MSARRSDGRRVVPLEVAREIVEERDRAIEQLEAARRRIQQLETEVDELRDERDELEEYAREAEREVGRLRDKLDEIEERMEVSSEAPESGASAETEKHQLEERAKRLAADLKRVQGRTAESVEAARRDERIRLLSGLGEVLDAIERALEMGEASGPWRQGLEAIRNRFLEFLEREGAELIGEVGEKMDPNIHRAVSTVEDPDVQKGRIVHVDRPGIVLEDGSVVRPAQVVVAG